MIKMPCLFVREFHGRDSFTTTEQVTPGCEWVLAGEGTASIKRDGTACQFLQGQLWKRYDAKRDPSSGRWKDPPAGARKCTFSPDEVTGHWPFWAPLVKHDYWHHEAFARQASELVDGATYELCGPKLQGNPERFERHTLIRHGAEALLLSHFARTPSPFAYLQSFLSLFPNEGIVFAHSDGRYAKIRRSDFGLAWPLPSNGGAR